MKIRAMKKEPRSVIFRERIHEIIFEADTRQGRMFDTILFFVILVNVFLVILESIPSLKDQYMFHFYWLEWIFTGLFTLEYFLRIYSVKKPVKYILSFYGIIDLLSILPSFIGLFIFESHSLRMIRILRLMRVFRVFKMMSFSKQARQLRKALLSSRQKILVFLYTVVLLVMVMGTLMYMLESAESGFTSIPQSIYWAIVTLTTVGYGDITPQTVPGQMLASVIMIIGYAIIAVPTGIVTAEMMNNRKMPENTQACPSCSKEGHDDDASHCKFCGHLLNS
jgi:voltage-gated potassium channel